MRWKLLRRRLSVSAPRMTVRSHLPWPLRWLIAAVMLGFSAALALWAFEFGKEIAGLDRGARQELAALRAELADLRSRHDQARQLADSADSLIKSERAAQERLAQQLRQLETDRQALQSELNFYQRRLPAGSSNGRDGLQLRGLQAEVAVAGQLQYRMLVVQPARGPEFNGRYELVLSGVLDGRPWSMPLPGGSRPLQVRQVARVEGTVEHPAGAMIKTVQVRIVDARGATQTSGTAKL